MEGFVQRDGSGGRQFEKFTASRIYCPNCKASMPVKERLLLVLPDGHLYDYRCIRCRESLGTCKDSCKKPFVL